MERYKITVELEGNASPELFKLVREMVEMIVDVTDVQWDAANCKLLVEYVTRKKDGAARQAAYEGA